MNASEGEHAASVSRCDSLRRATFAAAICVLVTILWACASAPPSPYGDDLTPLISAARMVDQRARFREIVCAVLQERDPTLPDDRPCEEALTRVGAGPDGTGRAVDVGPSRRRLIAAIVPGIGWDCYAEWLDLEGTTAVHVRQLGYDEVMIKVDALSSSATNARQIRDAIMAMDVDTTAPRLVLIGYSKGAPDILEAVVSYPEIRPRIAAVVAVAGAVGGSPLARDATQAELELVKKWPGADCSEDDNGGIESLRPATRQAWLAEHPLPADIPYFSLATCPQPGRISAILKPSYRKLSKVDPRNDGMVLLRDELIPGSTFLGCLNADHWAASVPIARSHPHLAAVVVNHNDYPREALLEAILRFVEEDLATAERWRAAATRPGRARSTGSTSRSRWPRPPPR